MRMSNWIIIPLLCLSALPALSAQETAEVAAVRHLQNKLTDWGLEAADIADLAISDQYQSRHNGVTHIYYIQRYDGIEIYNALAGVHLNDQGEVLYSNHRFFDRLEQRVQARREVYTAAGALNVVAADLGLPQPRVPQVIHRSRHQVNFVDPTISRSPVRTKMVYYPTPSGQLVRAWQLRLEDPRSAAGWNMFVDVETGEVLSKQDETIYCTFDHAHGDGAACAPPPASLSFAKQLTPRSAQSPEGLLFDGATYFVFPADVESPIHGERRYVVDPADPLASPYGWHDTNGRTGPEYTFTRGNNAHAYLDAQSDDGPDIPEPEGGEELFFEFPYTTGGKPGKNSAAAVTQVFYMTNVMHDYLYYFGFDEQAGNYQQNNYGKGGKQGDPVRGEAQDGSDINNASFLPTEDGINGRMQMHLWSVGGNTSFIVESPAGLAGDYAFSTADFGPLITNPIIGDLAEGISLSTAPKKGCTPLDGSDVSGKIVLIDRGDCFFEEKAKNAEAAGALACVICNNEAGLVNMSGIDTIPDPDIPTIMIGRTDCAKLRTALQSGGGVSVRLEPPDFLDASFDNAIIAHEYAHGVSTRLTAGPSRVGCLPNAFPFEQMGEGWSDFFAMVATQRAGEDGANRRTLGNFPMGQSLNGSGIRRQPYSTDMDINNQTYDDIIGEFAPHQVGEVWAATLWDLYWAFIDRYGYNADPTDKTAGNNIALQLIMDGMKLQPCRPGFVDGRDAIIASDLINNDGANECLIWEIFARRGIGWSAQQREGDNRNDNSEAFDLRPECVATLKIAKKSTPLIEAGDNMNVELNLRNDKTETLSEVMITDIIPAGCTLVAGTVKGAPDFRQEGNTLYFEVGDLSSGAIKTISYSLQTPPDRFSQRIFYDDMENGPTNWSVSDLAGTDTWRLSVEKPRAGQRSWFIPSTTRTNDQALQMVQAVPLDMERPVLRFYHDYDIQPGLDGGTVEVSTNGSNWTPVDPGQVFRNPFTGRIPFQRFGVSKQQAFWGNSNRYVASYVDLSTWKGQDIRIRFRYGSDQDLSTTGSVTDGWFIDDIELMDMDHYATEACVSSAEGDQACTVNAEKGTVIESRVATPTSTEEMAGLRLHLFPNPVTSNLNIVINTPTSEEYQMELTSLEGKVLRSNRLEAIPGSNYAQLDLSALPKGVYVLKLEGRESRLVEKIVVQ